MLPPYYLHPIYLCIVVFRLNILVFLEKPNREKFELDIFSVVTVTAIYIIILLSTISINDKISSSALEYAIIVFNWYLTIDISEYWSSLHLAYSDYHSCFFSMVLLKVWTSGPCKLWQQRKCNKSQTRRAILVLGWRCKSSPSW